VVKRLIVGLRVRLASVRARSALAAATIVMTVVGMAGVGLIVGARAFLTASIVSAATQRAQQVAQVIPDADETDLADLLRANPADSSVAQVLDGSGHVVAASPELVGRPALTSMCPAPGTTEQEQRLLQPGDADPTFIVAVGVNSSSGLRTAVVAQSLGPVNESIEFLTHAVVVGSPGLAVVVGLATFLFVGRSLRPVEAIRSQVASISGQDLRARVPVPATHDDVAALARTMNAMLERLQTAVESQHRFVADASHELRSPLTTLKVGLDVLAANPHIPPQQVQRLSHETDRLSRLVTDLLLLARADENGLDARLSDVDLDDLAYRIRERLHLHDPDLRVELRLRPVRIAGDPNQLDRAIANLCDNAARYARSLVTISVWTALDAAHLSVADDGPGIAPSDRERVFDRFVRLDDSRVRSAGGAGLGLAITREIVHRHGGTVTVEASPTGGAQFHVRLPMTAGSQPNGVGP
jgi:signal transduction histidine kinase